MKSRISENETLKEAFRRVHFAKGKEDAEGDWRSRVMRRIRQIGPLNAGVRFWPQFEHLVWRLVPASSLVVLALTFLLLNMDLDPNHDYLATVQAELERPTLAELYSLEG